MYSQINSHKHEPTIKVKSWMCQSMRENKTPRHEAIQLIKIKEAITDVLKKELKSLHKNKITNHFFQKRKEEMRKYQVK